ncbi:MAG: OmpA family protein, partial [Rhodospirillaceae bacterium]|nr:OmpA family protein [Rhodospirillaceae bacterium]
GVSSGYGSGVSAAAPVTAVMANAGPLTHIARPARPLTAGAVKVATINFSNGSASLSSRDRQIIANAHQLQKERGGKIHIVGHASSRTNSTDPVRHKMVNFKVSVDRADAIARELIRLGVKKEEMVVDAISDANPLYFEFMPTGEAGNRRAEIYLES